MSARLKDGWAAARACALAAALAVALALIILGMWATLAVPAVTASVVHVIRQGTPGERFDLIPTNRHGVSVVSSGSAGMLDRSLVGQGYWDTQHRISESPMPGATGSVQPLADGSLLVCSGGRVVEVDPENSWKMEWRLTSAGDYEPVSPSWAGEFSDDGHNLVLIADAGAHRVVAVDKADETIAWQYGDGSVGSGIDQLTRPLCAQYVASGTDGRPSVLIADAGADAPRVIEVRWSDYDAKADHHGFKESSVVWQYGGTPGTGSDQVVEPTQAEREDDGSTLIADAAADRVLRVDGSGAVLWQYGVPGLAGVGSGRLNDPMGATEAPGGRTLIADTGNARVILVRDSDKTVVWTSPAGGGAALAAPRAAVGVASSARSSLINQVWICDRDGSHAAHFDGGGATVNSRVFTLPSGVSAHFLAVRWHASAPVHTKVWIAWRSKDGTWVPGEQGLRVSGSGSHSLRGLVGPTLQYNVHFTRGDLAARPALLDLSFTYTTVQVKTTSSHGHGGGSEDGGTASGAGTSGATGVGGSGNGSGVGAGQGTGSDLGGSGASANQASPGSNTSSGAQISGPASPAPFATSAAGTGSSQVTGIRLSMGELSGGAHGGGGGSPPPPTARSAAWLWPVAGVLAVAGLLLAAPLAVRRRMRRLLSAPHPDERHGWAS